MLVQMVVEMARLRGGTFHLPVPAIRATRPASKPATPDKALPPSLCLLCKGGGGDTPHILFGGVCALSGQSGVRWGARHYPDRTVSARSGPVLP